MKKFMNKKKKDNKGFSLVELVIVVAIMAILVGILAPQYIKYVERSRKSADASNIDNFATAIKVANADGSYNIPADTYRIMMDKDGVTVGTGVDGNKTKLNDAFVEYVGTNWAATKLKSTKWGVTTIQASCEVAENGSVTVTYTPATLADSLKED